MRECAALVMIGIVVVASVPSNARGGQVEQQPTQSPQAPVDLLWRTEPAESDRVFSVTGLRFGVDQRGDLTVAGRGRFFAPFGRRSALQLEASYDWYHDRREGQVDIGLVNRVGQVQLGLFSSVRYVNLDAFDHGRSLSQFGGTVDYVFGTGRVGVYATAALEDTALAGRRQEGRYLYEETTVRLADQFGANWWIAAGRFQLEGHMAVLKPVGLGKTTGGSLRLAYPLSDGWALTAEGAWNPSLVRTTTQGRFTVGIRMGEWPSARPPSSSTRPAPIEIPAIRYSTVTREVRDGNDAPFADAGPDQVIVPECPTHGPCRVAVKVDALGSFDPDGDLITYRWTPRSGFADGQFPTPSTNSWVEFQGEPGRTYVMRVQVTDDRGATAFDDVTVTILKR